MIKRQIPSVSEKELLGKRTVRVSPKITLVNPRLAKKNHGIFKSKQATPKKCKKINNDLKLPRTCAESPLAMKGHKHVPIDPQPKPLGIRVTEIIRVSHTKELPRTHRISLQPPPLSIADILVSPIQKIHMTFLNNEDHSLITTLATLSYPNS